MPAPQASQLESIASAALQSAGIRGENAPDLAKAVAQITADALTLFLNQAMIMPGIPAAVSPVDGSGSTVGPGLLAPPPVGGPTAPQLEGLAQAVLTSNGLKGRDVPALAKVIAGAVTQGIMMFTLQVQVSPGMAIAGFTTTAPGNLM